jgi:hypothetical protein
VYFYPLPFCPCRREAARWLRGGKRGKRETAPTARSEILGLFENLGLGLESELESENDWALLICEPSHPKRIGTFPMIDHDRL